MVLKIWGQLHAISLSSLLLASTALQATKIIIKKMQRIFEIEGLKTPVKQMKEVFVFIHHKTAYIFYTLLI